MASAQTTTLAAIYVRVLLVFREQIVKRVTKLKDLVVNIFFWNLKTSTLSQETTFAGHLAKS